MTIIYYLLKMVMFILYYLYPNTKIQKKGGKYINKLLRLQPAELKVETKRRKEKNLRLRIENDYLKNERLLLLL